MKVIALILVFLGLGVFLYGLFTYREIFLKMRGDEKAIAEREKEIFFLYQSSLKELEENYSSLIEKGNRLTIKDKKKLADLAERIEKMKAIIQDWERTEEEKKKNALYRMCVEIYPQTKGICEYLKEKSRE